MLPQAARIWLNGTGMISVRFILALCAGAKPLQRFGSKEHCQREVSDQLSKPAVARPANSARVAFKRNQPTPRAARPRWTCPAGVDDAITLGRIRRTVLLPSD
jgi:hypothetical protein